jgi:hypothetical protein
MTDPTTTVYENDSYFGAVGEYNVYAYWDTDYTLLQDTANTSLRNLYREDVRDNTSSGQQYYNESYGSNETGNGNSDWIIAAGSARIGRYNYSTCGPWDPPEQNATVAQITVTVGKPVISWITPENATVYYGYDTRLDLNATNEEGQGITGATIKLRKVSGGNYVLNATDHTLSYAYTGTDGYGIAWGNDGTFRGIWINETDTTNHPGNYSVNITRGHANWTYLGNYSWYIYVTKDINQDGTDEYNNTIKFTIKASSPPVRLTITDDGDETAGSTKTDKKVNVQAPAGGTTGPAGYIDIQFTILGRSVTGNRAYYGDDAHEITDVATNLQITGDILYPVKYGTGTTLTSAKTLVYVGSGLWKARIIPTKPGGSIRVSIDWPGNNNGSDSEILNIINGTTVEPEIESFFYGDETTLTVTVKDMDGAFVKYATVYLFWKDGSSNINSTTGTNIAGNGQNGQYSFLLTVDDMGSIAPLNITIAAKTPGFNYWGYGKVEMQKKHSMVVNCSPTFTHAGNATLYDIDVSSDDASGHPATLTVAILDSDNDYVDSTNYVWTGASYWNIDQQEIILGSGTYTVHAFNNTHDSKGNNVTIRVDKYSVVSNPPVLGWLLDQDINMTFQVMPTGDGLLTINNMSTTPNCSSYGDTMEVDIADGVGTLENVNASTLGNLTFQYTPEGGTAKDANGLVKITTAIAVADPPTIYTDDGATNVEITVTHPNTGAVVSGAKVELDRGKALADSVLTKIPDAKNTGTDGKVTFGIAAAVAGNVTIYIKEGSDPTNPYVIECKVRLPMTLTVSTPAVNEGEKFMVSAKSAGKLITDETVSILFNGITYTTDTGTIELEGPSIISGSANSLTYPIIANAEGYTLDVTDSIMVLNVPNLFISVDSETLPSGQEFTVEVEGEDGNKVGISVTFNQETKISGPKGVKFTAPTVDKDTEYQITATKDGYIAATAVTITIVPTPGFELLTLIVAIGVAFILLRRRRR